MTRLVGITAAALLILACHRTNIDRAQWQSMSMNEKALYVRTLLGHEKTKEAKGGNDRVFTRSIDEYVKRIDDAYARGDTRTVDAIFETLGSPRQRGNVNVATQSRAPSRFSSVRVPPCASAIW